MNISSLDEIILLVDDDFDWLDSVEEMLQTSAYRIEKVTNGSAAVERIKQGGIFLVLMDLRLPDIDGIQVCQIIRKDLPNLPFVLVSGKAEKKEAIEGLRAGVTDILEKPLSKDDLLNFVKKYADRRQKEIVEENEEANALLQIFIDETRDLLEGLDESILLLEEESNIQKEIDVIFRRIHTIKGSCGSVVKAKSMSFLAHAMEDILSRIKNGKLLCSKTVVDLLLQGVDALKEQLSSLENNEDIATFSNLIDKLRLLASGTNFDLHADANVSSSNLKTEEEKGVFVANERLDLFMEMVGELIAVKNSFASFCLEPGYLSMQALPISKDINRMLDKVCHRIQSQVAEIRKVPLKRILRKLPRIARQVANETQKQVRVILEGETLSVDKSIASALGGCLSHAIRNAIDHGIELPTDRERLGKQPHGVIQIRAEQVQDKIVVIIEDDGRGLNKEAIIKKALQKSLISEHEASSLTDNDIYSLIFKPGFSTAEQITSVSGRGVGMDAIKCAIENLEGSIEIISKPDTMTRFTLRIPTINSINVERSILVNASDSQFAIPVKCIVSIQSIFRDNLTPIDQYSSIQHMGKTLRVASYREILMEKRKSQQTLSKKIISNSQKKADDASVVVVIQNREKSLGLLVDKVVGQFDAVVRPFNTLISCLPGFEGTAILNNGRVAYVVSSEEMIKLAFE